MSKEQSNPKLPLTAPPNPPPPPAHRPEIALALINYPELQDKLLEAVRTGHFLVTVHCQLVKPGQSGDLQHYLFQCGYPPGDIVASLKHIATVHAAKTNPAADVSGAKGWI
jgi:hypothetical protein